MTGSYDLGLFPGFIPQNTTFIRTTSSATAAIAIQNPISSPNRERVPNKRIQIFVQFIFSLLLKHLAVMTHIGLFHTGRQRHVKQDTRNQVCKITGRQRRKPQQLSNFCKRNNCKNCDSGTGYQCQQSRCTALDKWKLWCTDHMNNQRLAPHRFYEPACLKHCSVGRLHPQQLCAAKMTGQIVIQNSP